MPKPLLDRLADKIAVTDACWEWTGGHTDGYGMVTMPSRQMRGAHRVVYELLVGPIPDGMQLDHLCRNRGCVRPDHLEPVTQRTNIMRGSGIAAFNAHKTHCKYGHPFDDANTFWLSTGHRRCRICKRRRDRQSA